MPRTARASVGGVCYHVFNRGNARQTVFHDDADYQLFLDLADAAWSKRTAARLGLESSLRPRGRPRKGGGG